MKLLTLIGGSNSQLSNSKLQPSIISTYSMPDKYRYIELDFPVSAQRFTSPGNGWIAIEGIFSTGVDLAIESTSVIARGFAGAPRSDGFWRCNIRVNKDDGILLFYGTVTSARCVFIYNQGE